MLFNSYEFVFLFLPITLGLFFALGALSRAFALRWLILASVFFYGSWRPLNLLIIGPSIAVNYALARLLERLRVSGSRSASNIALLTGLAFNIAFLGYFKYAAFATTAFNDAFGTSFALAHVVLPLGVSFITFQKIAFLIDVHAGRVESFTLQEFTLFVLFFPQLIAGPIVHYRELMPQFQRVRCVFEREHLAVGMTLFVFGLFKKVYLADSVAPFVNALFSQAADGHAMSLWPSWAAALGFTLQIYFDFSGYTDMAIGAARCFGIRLPPNFNSPLKSSNIIGFWMNWHMTLTRFLTAYIYNPLSIWLTRRRLARGLPGIGAGHTTVGGFLTLLVLPTLVTMCVSGIWHGAGYSFIVWGLLHGVFLTVNHGWRLFRRRFERRGADSPRSAAAVVGWLLTFLSVTASMVVFRATSIAAALGVLKGMVGLNGLALPSAILSHLAPLASWLQGFGLVAGDAGMVEALALIRWIPLLAGIALLCPNSLELLEGYGPALNWRPSSPRRDARPWSPSWSPSIAWALVVSVVTLVAILHLGDQSEFLYWQF
jgi:D-alanyl-lipoteichoic acid acyltransferase DltB (MBOAT superfamily)